MEEFDDIEKSVLIVAEIKSLLLRDFSGRITNDEYVNGYGHGWTDALRQVRDIINKY